MDINLIERIKRLAIIAMVSNDYLMEQLVLKGGNAIDIVYQLSGRASIDLDYSMSTKFNGNELDSIITTIENTLTETFKNEGLAVFDLRFSEKPEGIGEFDEMEFWGGYQIEFKVIPISSLSQHSGDLKQLRKYATVIGPNYRKIFRIDISKFEYCEGKVAKEVDGYTLFVYSTEMLVLEKLRAICQQIPEYREKIVRSHPPSSRARDFFDIFTITQMFPIDMNNEKTKVILESIFNAKKVPMNYINQISSQREFHRTGFVSLKDTVKSGVDLKDFDFYFDYLLDMVHSIKH